MRYKIRSSDSKTPSSACHGGASAPPLASSEARTTRRELWNPVDDWEMKKPPPPRLAYQTPAQVVRAVRLGGRGYRLLIRNS